MKLAKQPGSGKAAQQSLKESSLSVKLTSISNITEGFDLLQEVQRSIHEALKDYLSPNQLLIDNSDVHLPVEAVTSAQYWNPCSPSRN